MRSIFSSVTKLSTRQILLSWPIIYRIVVSLKVILWILAQSSWDHIEDVELSLIVAGYDLFLVDGFKMKSLLQNKKNVKPVASTYICYELYCIFFMQCNRIVFPGLFYKQILIYTLYFNVDICVNIVFYLFIYF